MTDMIERTLYWLSAQMPGRLSRPGDHRYVLATEIWAKPVGSMPRAIVHCRSPEEVQLAIRAARDCDLPLSVRGGGHDWAGRALCEGIVIDLSGMRGVTIDHDNTAHISGSARAADVIAQLIRLALWPRQDLAAPLAWPAFLGGGYGPLIGCFGLALDNLFGAEVVLAMGASSLPTAATKLNCSGHCAEAAETLGW
jgi:FAD/FMN-containing dehydrogenase